MSILISALAIYITAASFYYQRRTAVAQGRSGRFENGAMITCLFLASVFLLLGIYTGAQ